MFMQTLRYVLAAIANFLIAFYAIDLLMDIKYGFTIFLIFGFLVPIRMVMIMTLENKSFQKKLLNLVSSFIILVLAIYWGRHNEEWLLYVIALFAVIEFVRDIRNTLLVIKSTEK